MSYDRFAEFALLDSDIPQSAFDMAATLLIDTIGVATGAADLEAGKIARDHALAFHNAGAPEHTAHMIFDGRGTSIPGAAFAAATHIDNLDAHDGYNPSKGHIGCAVVPATTSQAQYSLPFALAVMLVHDRIGPEEISGVVLSDPKVADVLTRVALREDARHSKRFPDGRWSDVTVTLTDGTQLASGDVQARGGPEAPMELSEVEAKFRMMAATLGEPRTTVLWEMRERLMQPEVKFSELVALVRTPVEETNA
ncbi:MmgE/PrpD family protein [Ruegeria halocynthiae]|uniref:MmgE/PrpD family protein n=1 Tax=Ruegeria halocynthiae TaxID=985054 RepID=A0A1H2YZM1_9RHOB|nr:MmgE/PrpD family protein [Ruegeria halocynthiae]SDX10556.1 MmgE/PrpD family protein [Ruegeria halocynthiae]